MKMILYPDMYLRNFFIGCYSFLFLSTSVQAQQTVVGKGWAQTSVNAVVFRKNSIATDNNIQYVAYYDSAARVVLARRTLPDGPWEVKATQYSGKVTDAHNMISIMVDGEGYLHMSWDHHNNALHYCKSVEPGSLELTDMLTMTGKEADVTYPEFHRLPSGDLIFMYRNGESGRGNLSMNRYDVKSKTWKRLHSILIDGENQRNAYWQACIDTKGTIHVSWVWRETWDVGTNHDLCYARSRDGGVTWEKSTGEKYVLPINAKTAEYACLIPQQSELINQTSMFADQRGFPYIATYWRKENSEVPQYFLVYRDSKGWKVQQVSKRATPFSLSGGGTKKIPISRPQIVVWNQKKKVKAVMIYRDAERDYKVSVATNNNIGKDDWQYKDLTSYSVGDWEPSYDTELYKKSGALHLYVQRVGQGDGEKSEKLPAQDVIVLEYDLGIKK